MACPLRPVSLGRPTYVCMTCNDCQAHEPYVFPTPLACAVVQELLLGIPTDTFPVILAIIAVLGVS